MQSYDTTHLPPGFTSFPSYWQDCLTNVGNADVAFDLCLGDGECPP